MDHKTDPLARREVRAGQVLANEYAEEVLFRDLEREIVELLADLGKDPLHPLKMERVRSFQREGTPLPTDCLGQARLQEMIRQSSEDRVRLANSLLRARGLAQLAPDRYVLVVGGRREGADGKTLRTSGFLYAREHGKAMVTLEDGRRLEVWRWEGDPLVWLHPAHGVPLPSAGALELTLWEVV